MKVYVNYIVSTGIDNSTNILGVFNNYTDAVNALKRAHQNIIINNPYKQEFFSVENGESTILYEYYGETKLYIKEVELNTDITLN